MYSTATIAAFGAYDWWSVMSGSWASTTAAYVLRLPTAKAWASPAPFTSKELLHAVALAGRELNRPLSAKLGANVTGVSVFEDGGKATIDVVFTFDSAGWLTPLARSPSDVAEAMAKDSLGQPLELVTSLAKMGKMTGPADAVAHWVSAPDLYSSKLTTEPWGAPTSAWSSPMSSQVVLGPSDVGAHGPSLLVSVPVGGGATPVAPPAPTATQPASSARWWVLGASSALLAYALHRRRSR